MTATYVDALQGLRPGLYAPTCPSPLLCHCKIFYSISN